MKKQILAAMLALVVLGTATTASATENKTSNVTITGGDKKAASAKENVTIVYADVDGHAVTTAMDKSGNVIYRIKRYTSDNLAKNVMDVVARRYGNFYITSMEEVQQPGSETVFIVHAEDATSLKTFRVADGDAELVQDFVKG